MTRDLFLQELRIALQGKIAQIEVNEQLRYYENYIIEESRKGRTQEQVMESLGSPRLIAKTIIQMSGAAGQKAQGQEAFSEQEKRDGRDIHFGRFRPRSLFGRILSGSLLAVFFVLLLRIGIVLLPLIASAFMAGAIFYVVFLIFFGNKK